MDRIPASDILFLKMRGAFPGSLLLFLSLLLGLTLTVRAEDPYVEPGSLRLSNDLRLENILHAPRPGWQVQNNGLEKSFSKNEASSNGWKAEWGQSLLTEAATRITPDFFARVLFEAQGDYADRYWRPNNINHFKDNQDDHFIFRQAEGRLDKDRWFVHGFSGVGHTGWGDKGDLFDLYPASYPDDDYLGQSSYFGIYPDTWKQDLFLNISHRHSPQGVEAGADIMGVDAGAALGSELQWGYSNSYYGRLGLPLQAWKVAFVFKNEDVPFLQTPGNTERRTATSLTAAYPSDNGNIQVGLLYQPFRSGEKYLVARSAANGSGLLGSSTIITDRTSRNDQGLGFRLRMERKPMFWNREWFGAVDYTYEGVLAGNKEEIGLQAGTSLLSFLHGQVSYSYRKPIEGPIPFLFEGSIDNLGAVAANPRGPESPFNVDWSNREAAFVVTTLTFDPTPNTNLFQFDPTVLSNWNVNKDENAPFALSFQHRMSDYRTTTDRMYYYDNTGNIVWEPAAHSGAWPSHGFLQEVRLLAVGKASRSQWMLGVAGGQSPALSSLAYSNDATVNKPLTEYYSIEGRIRFWPFDVWSHYGSGIWAPDPVQYFFGHSIDELWGVGMTYHLTSQTKLDVSYLAVRQDDSLFLAPEVGAYDEIRTVFSHRFGFVFLFQEAPRPGFEAR